MRVVEGGGVRHSGLVAPKQADGYKSGVKWKLEGKI